MQEKENILYILKKTKEAIKRNDVVLMKELSNMTIHSASIYNDADNIAIAVIIYGISKIIERKRYRNYKEWPSFFSLLVNGLNNAITSLEKNDINKFRESLKSIRSNIKNISGHLHNYIEAVFRKAQINKASRIYEHGISMQQTANLLGISVFELAEYVGKTGIADVDLSITLNIEERIKFAEEIFK